MEWTFSRLGPPIAFNVGFSVRPYISKSAQISSIPGHLCYPMSLIVLGEIYHGNRGSRHLSVGIGIVCNFPKIGNQGRRERTMIENSYSLYPLEGVPAGFGIRSF
jgi:hypothetical protein